MSKEEILYKYVPPEIGLKILYNKTLRFSNPKIFNDPYDSNMPIIFKKTKSIDNEYYISLLKNLKSKSITLLPKGYNIDKEIKKIKNNKIGIYKDPQIFLQNIMINFKEYMRVLSLSKINNNILMWGHYADSHKGIVIGFKKSYDFFKLAKGVKYCKSVYKLNGEIINDPFLQNEKSRDELNKLLLTKCIDWEYENEYRCILDVEHEYQKCYNNIKFKSLYPKLIEELKTKQNFIHIPFSPNSVDSIYFGTKLENTYKKLYLLLIKSCYPNTKIYQGSLSENNFEIIFNKIDTDSII